MVTQQQATDKGTLQRNVNTVMLFLITTGIAWALKSIDNLEQRMIRLETSTGIYNDANANTQKEVNRNGLNIGDLQIRMSRIELLIQQPKK